MMTEEGAKLVASIAEAERALAARGWTPNPEWGRFCNGDQVAGAPPGGEMQSTNWREASLSPFESAHRLMAPAAVAMDESGFAVGSFFPDRNPPA